jgi:sugar phosphate isomerase/epimerase
LLYGDGYLPVIDVVKAVLKMGFRSWFSYEVFDAGPDGKRDTFYINDDAMKAKNKHELLMRTCASAED